MIRVVDLECFYISYTSSVRHENDCITVLHSPPPPPLFFVRNLFTNYITIAGVTRVRGALGKDTQMLLTALEEWRGTLTQSP